MSKRSIAVNKIGVILELFYTNMDRAIMLAAQIGAEGVQFYGVNGELDCDRLTATQKIEVGKKLEASNLEISAICADLGGHGFEIEKDNPDKISKTMRVMQWAKELNCQVLTTHIGVIPKEKSHPRRKILLEACKRLNEHAHKFDVCLAIETGPELVSVLYDFLEELNCPNICVNYDPANLVMVTGDDPILGVHTLKKYIVHTHAKDGIMKKKADPKMIYDYFAEGGIEDFRLSDYFEETPFRAGSVNIHKWVMALKEIGYKGFITIERETGERSLDELSQCIYILKEELAFNG